MHLWPINSAGLLYVTCLKPIGFHDLKPQSFRVPVLHRCKPVGVCGICTNPVQASTVDVDQLISLFIQEGIQEQDKKAHKVLTISPNT